MKKILEYTLIACAWLNTAACLAAEKFEVLPDLPDPLAYAVQPAGAASVSGTAAMDTAQTIGHEPSLVSVVLSLLFVILLIYLTGILYTKLNKFGLMTVQNDRKDMSKSKVTVVSTTPLGSNKTLHIVELDGKRMLIGASSGAIQLIKDLGSINPEEIEEEYSHIEIPTIKIPKIEIPKIEIPSIGLSKLATKIHKDIIKKNSDKEDENTLAEEDNASPVTEEEEEETSDGIIDSLFTRTDEIAADNTSNTNDVAISEHIVDPDEFALYKKYLG